MNFSFICLSCISMVATAAAIQKRETVLIVTPKITATDLYGRVIDPDTSAAASSYSSRGRLMFSNSSGAILSCVTSAGVEQSRVTWTDSNGQQLSHEPLLRGARSNGSLLYDQFAADRYRPRVHRSAVRCLVRRNYGAVLSRTLSIQAVIDQSYQVVVDGVRVPAGATAVLRCRLTPSTVAEHVHVTGWRVGSQWMAVGHLSDSFLSWRDILLIRGVAASDARSTVACETTSMLNGKTQNSESYRLEVVNEPAVAAMSEAMPSQIRASSGDTVILCCAVTNWRPPGVFRWSFSESLSSTQSELPVLGAITLRGHPECLELPAIQGRHTGYYRCVYQTGSAEQTASGSTRLTHSIHIQVKESVQVIMNPSYMMINSTQRKNLSCDSSAASFSHPIRWFKDGARIASADQLAAISLPYIGLENTDGVYQCQVGDQLASAQVVKPALPTFKLVSPSLFVDTGSSVTFTCTVTSPHSPVNATWQFYASVLRSDRRGPMTPQLTTRQLITPAAFSRTSVVTKTLPDNRVIVQLTVSPVKHEDEGYYMCAGENDAGNSGVLFFVNVDEPVVALPRRSITVTPGSRIPLQCPVTGPSLKRFVWRRNGFRLGWRLALEDGSLPVDPKTGLLSGNYSCQATGLRDIQVTGYVDVVVKEPPRIAEFAFRKNLRAGEREQVTCLVLAGDLPITIKWLKNNKSIVQSDRSDVLVHYSNFSSALMFPKLAPHHEGLYTCEVYNSAATESYSARLSILAPPVWDELLVSKQFVLAEKAVLQCTARGKPKPRIKWFKIIDDRRRTAVLSDGGRVLVDDSSGRLELAPVSGSDAGNYSCTAYNGVGDEIRQFVAVKINVPARFAVHRRNLTVLVGESVNLTCTPTGDQPIRFSWLRQNEPISGQNDASPVLTLIKVERKHSGHYTCVARNAYGSDRVTWEIMIADKPGPPQNVAAAEVTSRSAVITWSSPSQSEDRASQPDSYVIQCVHQSGAANGRPAGWQMANNFTLSSHQRGFLLTDLQPSTEYRVRLMAINSLGPSQPSHVISVVTMTEPPSGPPLNLRVRALSSTRIAVSWSPPVASLLNGRLIGYYVHYRWQKSQQHSREVRRPEPSVVLRNLQPNTAYNVQVIAFNEAGAGPPSVTVSVTTLQDVPRVFPGNVTCQNGTSAALWLTWQPLPGQLSSGTVVGYRIVWRKLHLQLGDLVHVDTSDTEQFRLDGLDSYTDYLVMVSAATSVGVGPNCPPVVCTTAQSVPQPPARVKAARLWDGSSYELHIVWEPPLRANGVLLGYTVYIQDINEIQRRTVDASTRSLNLNSVLAGAIEGVWISASNTAGESRFSSILTGHMIKTARVGILSFSTRVAAVVTRPVTLDCITSRQSAAPIWKHSQRELVSSHYHRLTHLANGSLLISHVTRSDEGDWSCSISSGETITVQLHPVTPPTVTSPRVIMATQSTLKVAWQLIDDGGMPIQKYHIRYGVRGSGEWRHLVWLEGTTEVLLAGLLCGTEYSVTVSADNTLTGGQHSQPLLAATNGNKPTMPSPEGLFITNSTCITLRLYDWLSECDVTQYTVRLQPVDSAHSPISRRPFSLFSAANDLATVCNLSAATWYRIVAEANSEAGSTKIESLIATLTSGGERLLSPSVLEHSNSWPKDLNGHLFAFSTIALALIITVFTVFCFVKFRRKMRSTGKRCPNHRSFTDVPGADQTSDCGLTLDHHFSTRECKRFDDLQPYATLDLRKLKYMDQSETCRHNGGNFCHYASVDAVTGICASKDEPAHCRTLQSGVSLQPFCANDITAAQQLQLASSVPPPPRRYTPMTEFAYQNVWSKDTVVLSPEEFLY